MKLKKMDGLGDVISPIYYRYTLREIDIGKVNSRSQLTFRTHVIIFKHRNIYTFFCFLFLSEKLVLILSYKNRIRVVYVTEQHDFRFSSLVYGFFQASNFQVHR